MPMEVEAKIRVDDLPAIGAMLARLGAVNEGARLERNWVLDDAGGGLARRGVLLRVRNLGGPGGVVTVKRPVAGGEFKTREETETMVDSTEDALLQFEIIGFRPVWLYEKIRETWLWRDCVLALDRCPEIGSFVEIEGGPDAIRAVAADLGLDPGRHIEDNYLGLWIRHLAARGEERRDMTFPPGDVPRA